MKQLFTIISIVGMLSLSVSCSKEAVKEDYHGEIVFKTDFEPEFSAVAQTKASIVDANALNSSGFNVTATKGSAGSETQAWNNIAFSKSGSIFRAGGAGKWWPSTNPSYHFYAANSALTFAAAGTTVSPSDNSKDVVVAYKPSPTYNDANSLQFEHIYARIGQVSITATDGYTITNFTVKITPRVGGTYNIRTGNGQTNATGWSSTSNGSETTIASASSVAAGSTSNTSNDLYLLPGDYTLTAAWTATKDDYTASFSGKTVNVSIQKGKVNTISANLKGNATEITFTISVTDWGSNAINAGTFPVAMIEPTINPVDGLSQLGWNGVPFVYETKNTDVLNLFGC